MRYGQNPKADRIVERLIEQNVKACQSSLIDTLLNSGEIDGFSTDDIENVYIDPSDWTTEALYEFADSNNIELDDDPRKISRESLEEIAIVSGEPQDYTDEELREEIADDKCNEWKDQIREWSEENPQEHFQWFLVDSWLCGKLREMGEIVIDNDYGEWWGRGCYGQAIALDPTFYRIAESLGYFDDLK